MEGEKRGIKRPRSESLATGSTRKKDSHKKKKVNSSNDASSELLETYATPEGRIMAQALSTLNNAELSRFEAFRRCVFRGDSISDFVAHCLAVADIRRYAQREGTRQYLGARGLGVEASSARTAAAMRRVPYIVDGTGNVNAAENSKKAQSSHSVKNCQSEDAGPRLSDLVAPNAAQEITLVVSTLAKAYAQRLVNAARRVATAMGYPDDAKLLPKHFLEAHQYRTRAGVDPGFFMQPPKHTLSFRSMNAEYYGGPLHGLLNGSCSISAAALGTVDKNQLKHQAALAAQEAYDKYLAERKTEHVGNMEAMSNAEESNGS